MPLLDDYKDQLATIHGHDDLNGQHADWIWERTDDDVAEAIATLNQNLHFTAVGEFRPHIMTTSVGDARGILFVSANPGWRPKQNEKENRYRRSSIVANRAFCGDFFNVFRREVGGNGWWSRALLLAHLVRVGAPAPGQLLIEPKPPVRWAWAQGLGPASGIGNVDLIPLHSTGDEFRTLQGADHNPGQQMLLEVATATLDMVLRLAPVPELIFVGSSLGAPLMDGLCEARNMALQAMPEEDVEHPRWSRLHRWVHPVTGAKVMTFPYQVFAGNASRNLPPGFMVPLADRVKAFMDAPVG